ncbi:glycoside hydrolase family 108 protein [Geoalkalibacter sp.]|uniref:glycoside hydrolase family 108 protein n=1 Tax=Geoalkalibacter sp. TaxID=3041440 RepID=UPI00272E3E49|nr:N-acetylmuramidase [Geoalkalibacter sp.]
MTDPVFDFAVTRTLQHEGGLVHDPADPGGLTNFGISQRAYPLLDIAALSVEDARAIYLRDYWRAPGFAGLTHRQTAALVFDLAVVCGVSRATRFLQEAANLLGASLDVDGKCGPATRGAVNGQRHQAALRALIKHLATAHFLRQNKPRFLAGWLNRLESPL